MGLFKPFSDGPTTPATYKLGEPQPTRYTILEEVEAGGGMVVTVYYPDCTTYGGKKILVYYKVSHYRKCLESKVLDPHFLENGNSPIARFAPTKLGKRLALKLAYSLMD